VYIFSGIFWCSVFFSTFIRSDSFASAHYFCVVCYIIHFSFSFFPRIDDVARFIEAFTTVGISRAYDVTYVGVPVEVS